MRLASFFLRLPHTLLVTYLALTASAVPVESAVALRILTPDDFKQTVSKGVWFIEHFSPYCRHCRDFAPTWEQLVAETQNSDDPGIHLAQVNCAVHGDLCRENKVDGYPQMNLYKDGQLVEIWNKARDHDELLKYITEHAEPTGAPKTAPASTAAPVAQPQTSPVSYDKWIPSGGAQIRNPTGTVLSLNEKTFFDAVSRGHIFVKFFAPWCGHCKKLAPVWAELARLMKDKLTIAEVNCEEHNALCRTQDVSGYPMLYYYTGSKKDGKTEYTGSRKLDQLKAYAEKLIGPPIQELKPEHLSKTIQEHPVVYVLLHPASNTRPLDLAVEGSHVLFGSPSIYVSSSPELYRHFSIDPSEAVVLALKEGDDIPVSVYRFSSNPASDKETLVKWLLHNRLPVTMELDSDTFQEVMNAPHKPLVVITATNPADMSATAAKVKDIARRWIANKGDTNVVFTWMDADKWGKWLKNMYGIRTDSLPGVVVADHHTLVYYDTEQTGQKIQLSPASVFSALNGVLNKTIPYKHSENIVERFARYINTKLVSLEQTIAHHPWRFVMFVVGALVLVVWFIKKMVWDDSMNDYSHPHRGRGEKLKLTRRLE
ncbi:thioredoxin-domain-containing protein [Panus rudis PR-1116 ss-1]|nr:thioredoxin-domain-containing protein [Panus rudis PR-1116 ss-1]